MTSAACVDPASEIVAIVSAALREAFDPSSDCPPDGGGTTTTVRFFASDGGLPFWDGHCSEPFLWVRLDRRYRSSTEQFPAAVVRVGACTTDTFPTAAVEIGVARCTVANDTKATWDDLAAEAEISLDDSWRIERVLCKLASRLSKRDRTRDRAVAIDTVAPQGPEGRVMAWTGMLYAEI